MRSILWSPRLLEFKTLFLGSIIFLAGTFCLSAQIARPDVLWSHIEAGLDQTNVDTSYQFVLDEVKAHCDGDADCLLSTCDTIRIKLERKFKLAAAVKVTHELIRVAEQKGLLEKMAQGHYDLSRYYDALQEARYALMHLDHSLRYFEQSGNKRKVIKCKFWRVKLTSQGSLNDHVNNGILESLAQEAIAEKDSALAGYILVHLLQLSLNTDALEESKSYFALFERIMKPDTKLRLERMHWGDFWHNKGIFERKNGNHQIAKGHFEHALAIFEEIEDTWRALNTTTYLIETDWFLGNRKEAKSRLGLSFNQMELLHSDDLFAHFYKIAAMIAEEEGHHKEALDYLKKKHAAEARIKETSDGKIADNYYLEVENKNKVLELNLRNNQLRYTAAIIVLIFFLAIGLLIGLYQQRRRQRELAAQNTLIQQQSEQLKSLDAAKSRFFANISHELRTPLTLLTSPISTLLKGGNLTERQTQLLQIAERSGKQLGQLINEILDLRKLEMGKMNLMPEPTELRPWFQTYFAQFESLAEQKQIRYQHILDIPEQSVADLDREKCRQILFNLLSNAFKFTPPGGYITAQVQFSGYQLQLRMANSGPGIHPDDVPHIFDRYFQSTRPDKPAEGGTGIGLALCREYAQLFGGTIGVESIPDTETVFWLSVPLQRSATATAPAPPQVTNASHKEIALRPLNKTQPSPDNQKATLLIVEDNPDLRDYLCAILRDHYKVIMAEHGQAALGVMSYELGVVTKSIRVQKTHHSSLITPDLILSDLMMPVMDGYQLLERLKSDDTTRHIPVIMLTASAEAQDKLKALRIGVDDYLTKPFDEAELLARIENLLSNQAVRRQTVMEDKAQAEAIAAPQMSQADREWLENFERYVQKHYSSDILSVSALSHEFAMSESTLLRHLKRLTGLSPQQYIQEVRLNEARRLLENRAYNSIAKVAEKVGYDDARTFARSFKQRFGKLPSEVIEG